MNLKRYIFSKTFMKIFLIITTANLLMVSIYSYANYSVAKKRIMHAVQEKQEDATTYIGLQIKNMNDMVENFCTSLFLDADIKQLMYKDDLSLFLAIKNTNRLTKVSKSNIFVDSVIVYNGLIDRYFESDSPNNKIDYDIEDLLQSNNLPYLTPIFQKGLNDSIYLIYAMYELDINDRIIAAQLVNIDLEWLDNLLQNLEPEYANLYLINSNNNEIILGESESNSLYHKIKQKLLDNDKNISFDIRSQDNNRYYVNVSSIPETDWLLINEQEYNHVFNGLDIYKKNILAILIGALIVSIIISWMLADRVYRPFSRLSRQLKSDLIKPQDLKDDVKYLEQLFEIKNKKIVQLEAYRNNTQEIIGRNTLLYLITDYEQLLNQIDNKKISIENQDFFKNGKWMLVAITIDYFNDFTGLPDDIVKNIKETIADYIELNISKEYCIKWIYLGGGEYILFIKMDKEIIGEDFKHDFERYKETINRNIKDVTVSVFMEHPVTELSELSNSYINIKMMYEYQIFYGKKCTVTYEDIQNRKDTDLSYPHVKPLIKALKEGTEPEIMEAYDRWKDNAVYSDLEYYMFHVMKLLININQVVRELELEDNKLVLNLQVLFKTIFTLDTVEEIEERLKQLLLIIYRTREQKINVKPNESIISKVKDYVHINYSDSELCLKAIAQEFNLSTQYFGAQFKKNEGISVSKYIHKVRMRKFIDGLSNTSYPTIQIMRSVGYENESNFYKLFKKEFGVTPNEYRKLLNGMDVD